MWVQLEVTKIAAQFFTLVHLTLKLHHITRENSGSIIVQLGEIKGVRGLR